MKGRLKKMMTFSLYDGVRYFKTQRKRSNTNRLVRNYLASHKIHKLHIGCGGNILPDWLNSDIEPYFNTIAFIDASKQFPITDEAFDYIYSEHVFEHINFHGQLNYLKESFRILKPGGKIRIATPDFDFLIKLLIPEPDSIQADYLNWNMNTFLPYVKAEMPNVTTTALYVINNYFRDWGHQLIHNKVSLKQFLEHAGFTDIKISKVNQSETPALTGLERHGEMITDVFNLLETMVFEAEKPRKRPDID